MGGRADQIRESRRDAKIACSLASHAMMIRCVRQDIVAEDFMPFDSRLGPSDGLVLANLYAVVAACRVAVGWRAELGAIAMHGVSCLPALSSFSVSRQFEWLGSQWNHRTSEPTPSVSHAELCLFQ